MKSQYNLQTIRTLIDKALRPEQVDELAFDRFLDVYRKFESDTSTSKKIITIVDFADRYGRIDDLLSYVKEYNPYQYKKYESQLRKVESGNSSNVPSTLKINNQRLVDADNIINQQVVDLLTWKSVAELSFDFMANRYGIGYDIQEIECAIDVNGSAIVQRSLTVLAYSGIKSLDTYLLVPESPSTEQEREVGLLNIKSLSLERKVEITNQKGDFQRLSVELSFVPPLSDGDEARFQLTEKLPVGLFAVNLPHEQIVQRETPYDYFAWNINRPTRRLSLQVTIPEKYSPDVYGVDVRYASASGLPAKRSQLEEQIRVQNVTHVSQDGRRILTLDVDYPMIGLIYMIRWEPKPSGA